MPLFHFDTLIADAVVRDEDGTEYPDQGSAITEARLIVCQMVMDQVRRGKPAAAIAIVVRSGETEVITLSLQDALDRMLGP